MRATRRLVGALLGVGLLGALGFPDLSHADERVDITATDGVQLIGQLAGTRGPGVVLVGNPDRDPRNCEAAAQTIAARGFRVLRFDLRGHGQSDGPADLSAIARDVEGAFRYLIGRKIHPIYLVSEEAGAAAALVVAIRVPAAAVVILGDPKARPSPAGRVRVETIPGDLSAVVSHDALARALSDLNGTSSGDSEALR